MSVLAPEPLIWAGQCCTLCCMSATRTQVYLTEEQRHRIDALAEAEGVTMAEIERNLQEGMAAASKVLAAVAGV